MLITFIYIEMNKKKMRLKSIGQKKRDMYHFVNVCKKFF